jgi:hypothetical protein
MVIGMFSGIVIVPLVLFVMGGVAPGAAGYSNLPWIFATMSSLQLVGICAGILMFRRESKTAKESSVIPEPGLMMSEAPVKPGDRIARLSLVQSNGAGTGRAGIR